jgi:hypothetical protein
VGLLVPAARGLAARQDWTAEASPATTTGTTLTANATPHSLGAITQVIASTEVEADWIDIRVHQTSLSATATDALLNIYIGAASSEVLLIDSLSVGWAPSGTSNPQGNVYRFPIRIAKGTRISAALRALIASDVLEVMITYGVANAGEWVGSGVETLGEVTASSRGTAVTPATAAPSWATMGTTGRRYQHIVLSVQGNNDTTAVGVWMSWTIGTGSAMYQQLGGILTTLTAAEVHMVYDTGRPCDIPSGTSLQLRSWASAAPSGDVYATLHGVY